jgi:hypothetical protein
MREIGFCLIQTHDFHKVNLIFAGHKILRRLFVIEPQKSRPNARLGHSLYSNLQF